MQNKTKHYQSITTVILATLVLLLVPFIAMQFTDEVNWSVADFILAFVLLFSTGLSFVLLMQYAANMVYRVAIASAIGTTLLMIWANLAVGLIGAGPNAGNLMYIGVVAIIITGMILSRFTPRGMEYTMFATALSLIFVVFIALLANMDEYPGSSVRMIIGVNAFFAILFSISGLLFRYIELKQYLKKSEG